jgi:serine/threonine protein phosphatase 1
MTSAYIIGDIHGMHDALVSLLSRIEEHKRNAGGTAELVFLGDYIDRGPKSYEVLDTVNKLTLNPGIFTKVTALAGNHEDMMIAAVYGQSSYDGWCSNGGTDTINSLMHAYGATWDDIESELMQSSLVKWVANLPVFYELGSVCCTHAGLVHMDMSAAEHDPQDLMWDRSLTRGPHQIYKLRVHGHTPVDHPYINEYAAYIDTAAVYGNKLTCLYIEDVDNPVKVSIISVDTTKPERRLYVN